MVAASWPVSSASRLAARPVGAASTTFAFLARASSTTERTVKLFPHPGPPVSTATFSVRASLTASACSGARSAPVRVLSQPRALSQSTDWKRGQPVCAGSEEVAEGSRQGPFGVEEGRQVDGPQRLGGRGAAGPAGFSLTAPSSAASSASAGRSGPRGPRGSWRRRRPGGLGEVAVAVVGGLRQRVGQAGLDPLGAVAGDADRSGDRVGGLEADAPHVGRRAGTARCGRSRPTRRRTSCRSSPPATWRRRRPAGRSSPP